MDQTEEDRQPVSAHPSGASAEAVRQVQEERFSARYAAVLREAGVKEGFTVWYQRHCERFIRFVRPHRLREVGPAEVTRFLERLWRGGDWEPWHVRQAEGALRLLFQRLVAAPWAAAWPALLLEMPEADDPRLHYRKQRRVAGPELAAVRKEFEAPLDRIVRALRYGHYAYWTCVDHANQHPRDAAAGDRGAEPAGGERGGEGQAGDCNRMGDRQAPCGWAPDGWPVLPILRLPVSLAAWTSWHCTNSTRVSALPSGR